MEKMQNRRFLFFFSFPFSNHFVYYYALYLLFLCFSLCLIFYISEYFPRYSLFCVCVCACMCNMCTYMFEYCFFFNSDKSTKLWLNYSALSLIAQLVMDREKKSYCEMYAVNSCETIQSFNIHQELLLNIDTFENWKQMGSGMGFQDGSSGKEPTGQCKIHKRGGIDLWVRKIPWRRAW